MNDPALLEEGDVVAPASGDIERFRCERVVDDRGFDKGARDIEVAEIVLVELSVEYLPEDRVVLIRDERQDALEERFVHLGD